MRSETVEAEDGSAMPESSSASKRAAEPGAAAPRVAEMPEMVLVGVVRAATSVAALAQGPMTIAGMWARFDRLKGELVNAEPGVFYEFHVERPTEPRMHFCLVGVRVTEIGAMPADMFVKVLPAGTYAVVTHRVLDGYAKLYEAFEAWLAASDFEEAAPFDVQRYDSRFTTMDDPASVQDVYIPIRRKRLA